MIRTTSLAEALECLYLKKKAVVTVSDEKVKYDSQMYILTKLLHHQGILLSVEDLEKGNYTKAQSESVIAASRKIKYFLRFVIC